MEGIGSVGAVFGIVAFVMCIDLYDKVKKLQKQLKTQTDADPEAESLREILAKSMGKEVKLTLEIESMDLDFHGRPCLLLDMDEEWLLLKSLKKEETAMLRLETVKGVQFL